MFTQFKLIVAALVIILILALSTTTYYLFQYKADYERTYTNELQLMKEANENKSLLLASGELVNVLTKKQEQLLDSLHIKPKYVSQLQEIEVFIHDTVPVYIPFISKGKYTLFTDTTSKCFVLNGRILADSVKSVEILEKSFNGEFTAIFHKGKRRIQKVWFIPLRIGPREPSITAVGNCGKIQITSIQVEK